MQLICQLVHNHCPRLTYLNGTNSLNTSNHQLKYKVPVVMVKKVAYYLVKGVQERRFRRRIDASEARRNQVSGVLFNICQ